MRVWGVASLSCDIRRKMGSIPSASLVRAPPPLSFKVTVPETQEEFSRLRVDAPLPDPPEGVLGAPGATKAYYEVSLKGAIERFLLRGSGLWPQSARAFFAVFDGNYDTVVIRCVSRIRETTLIQTRQQLLYFVYY